MYDIKEFVLLTTKFGGLLTFVNADEFLDTCILWKQEDPAAIGRVGYDLLVNNFYLQAAPTVAKYGYNISASTALNPASSKKKKKKTTSVRNTLEEAIIRQNNVAGKKRFDMTDPFVVQAMKHFRVPTKWGGRILE